MKTLLVLLVVKASQSTRERSLRNMGWWSYKVEEFVWDHTDIYTAAGRRWSAYDLVFIEDVSKGVDLRKLGMPVVYHSIDDTLSEGHLNQRVKQAGMADLTLVDHGQLNRFKSACGKARRFNYCVNDQICKPLEKEIDVAYHCGSGESRNYPGGKERNELRRTLDCICKHNDWSYRSGVMGFPEYTKSMGRARVVVNWPRTVINRPHRVMDAMACGAALLTGPIPMVEGDGFVEGVHYESFRTELELETKLDELLRWQNWEGTAQAGHELVMERHTWQVRARELRQMLNEELGL